MWRLERVQPPLHACCKVVHDKLGTVLYCVVGTPLEENGIAAIKITLMSSLVLKVLIKHVDSKPGMCHCTPLITQYCCWISLVKNPGCIPGDGINWLMK